MAARQLTDEEIDAALEGDVKPPSQTSQVSDEEIDAALSGAQPEIPSALPKGKEPRRVGMLEALPGQANVAEPVVRFGAASAGRGAALAVGLRNVLAAGAGGTWMYPGAKPHPVKFSPRTFVRKLEEMNVLSEATALDRIVERGGDIAFFVAAAGALTPVLMGAGLSAGMANTVGLVGLSGLDLKQQADTEGVKLEPEEYLKTAVFAYLFAGAGHYAGSAIDFAAQRILSRPLGQTTRALVKNSALGGLFEGGQAVVAKDPRWYEKAAAGVIGFNVGNAWFSGFPGMSRARIPTEVKKQVDIAGKAVEANEVDWRKELGLPRPLSTVELDATKSQATNWLLNRQVPWETSERAQKWTPAERDAAAAEANSKFGVDLKVARGLADRRPTKLEGEAIYESRKQEGLLLEAEARGTAVWKETAYRLGAMSEGERKLWEAERSRMTPEEQAAVSEQVPTAEEGLRRTEELERAIEEEPRAAYQPETVPPQRGVLQPPAPPEAEVKAGVEAERLRKKREKAEAGAIAQRTGQAQARGISEEAIATGAGVRSTAAERASQRAIEVSERAFEAEERRRFEAKGEEEARPPLRAIGEKEAPGEARARLLRGATGGFAEPRPEAVRSFEKETGTKVTEPTKETNEAPRPTKPVIRPGEAIAPEQASQAQVFASAGQGPPTPPTGATPAERAGEILGKKAGEALPKPTGPASKKSDKSRRLTIEAIEKATLKLEAENRARLGTKPELRPDEKDQRFFQIAPIALAAGSAAALAFAKEEDDRAYIAEMAGIPLFAALMRRPLSPGERWQTAEMRRQQGDIEKAVTPLEDLIYTGKPGPRGAEQAAVELAKALEDIPESPVRRWKPQQFDAFVTAAGHRLSKLGPAGVKANELAQDMVSNYLREVQGWRTRSRNEIKGIDMKPDVELPPNEKADLRAFMESFIPGFEGERPAWDSLSPSVQQRAAEQMLTYFNREIGPPEIRAGAKSALRFRDGLYAYFEKLGLDHIPGFQALKSVNGRYRQMRYQEEAFEPPSWLLALNPGEWQRRMDVANKIHEAIAKDQGAPVGLVRNAFRHARGEHDLAPFGEGVSRMVSRKSSNLDYHRVLESMRGKDWDPVAGQEQYVDGAASRIEFAKRFGANAEIADLLKQAAVKDGYSGKMFAEMLDAATLRRTILSTRMGKSGITQAFEAARPVTRELEAAIMLKSLGGFAIAQLPQPSLLPTHIGIKNFIKAWPKALKTSVSQSRILPEAEREALGDKVLEAFVANAGVTSQSVHTDYIMQQKGVVPRVLNGYLHWAGGQMDRFTRNLGAHGGDGYFETIFAEYKAARRRGNKAEETKALQEFRELFDEPVHRKLAAKGEAIEPEEYELLRWIAAEKVSNRVNYRRLPIDMPLFASHPVGRSFYLLSGYMIRSTAEFHRQLTQSLRNPAVYKRVLAGWLLASGFGVGAIQLNRMRRHKEFDPEKDSLARELIEGLTYAGLGTGFYEAFKDLSGEYGNPMATISGPFWGSLYEFGDTIPRARRAKSPDPVLKYLTKNIPVGPLPLVPGFPTPKEVAQKLFPQERRRQRRR